MDREAREGTADLLGGAPRAGDRRAQPARSAVFALETVAGEDQAAPPARRGRAGRPEGHRPLAAGAPDRRAALGAAEGREVAAPWHLDEDRPVDEGVLGDTPRAGRDVGPGGRAVSLLVEALARDRDARRGGPQDRRVGLDGNKRSRL